MSTGSSSITIARLLELQTQLHGQGRARHALGDGYLCVENPVYRRVRNALLSEGFTLTTRDPGSYFGFPLISLEQIFASRKIPYRDNVAPLVALEASRPEFFRLSDLRLNRPTPNYLLHESAHALAFAELFGRPKDVRRALSRRDRLVHVVLGEAYAMTAEYLAACCVSGPIHEWLFSINSYRHHLPGRKAIGELVTKHGMKPIGWAIVIGFLHTNFLRDRMKSRQIARALDLGETTRDRFDAADTRKLKRALDALMPMSPEFRTATTRLFLSMLGYPRDLHRILGADPLELMALDTSLPAKVDRLVDRLVTP